MQRQTHLSTPLSLPPSYAELTDADKQRASSPIIDVSGTPSFRVQIAGKEEVLSVHDVAVRFIRSLFLTAKDFLSGVPIAGAVLSVPLHYMPKQMEALKAAATEAGLIVLQLIAAPAAALAAYKLTSPNGSELPSHPDGDEGQPYLPGTELDRTVLVVDVGGTSTGVSLVYARSGLYNLLASAETQGVGGETIDNALVTYLSKEFTKKTKVPIDASNHRAWAKLRNEVELTKRTLSASNSAQCSVESLAEGIDFSHSVNRMRIDMCARKVWEEVQKLCEQTLNKAGLESAHVDEVRVQGRGGGDCACDTCCLLTSLRNPFLSISFLPGPSRRWYGTPLWTAGQPSRVPAGADTSHRVCRCRPGSGARVRGPRTGDCCDVV